MDKAWSLGGQTLCSNLKLMTWNWQKNWAACRSKQLLASEQRFKGRKAYISLSHLLGSSLFQWILLINFRSSLRKYGVLKSNFRKTVPSPHNRIQAAPWHSNTYISAFRHTSNAPSPFDRPDRSMILRSGVHGRRGHSERPSVWDGLSPWLSKFCSTWCISSTCKTHISLARSCSLSEESTHRW